MLIPLRGKSARLNYMYKIIQKRKIWYLISTLLIIPGIISLFVWGLRVGIDFAGGSLVEIKVANTKKQIGTDEIRGTLSKVEVENLAVQSSGNNQFMLRYKKPDKTNIKDNELADKIVKTIQDKVGEVAKVRFENVGPVVSRELTRKAIVAVVIASILLIFYIAWAFRGVSNSQASSWKMGFFAVIALIHDLLLVVGVFSILGHYFPIFEVDALFITALLTILGYSVNDTIVVFDRIRENIRRMPGQPLEEITNAAINQTLARSLNTSVTLFFVLLALFLLGGKSINSFILALLIGTVTGTYSSIFVASPLLVTFQPRKVK